MRSSFESESQDYLKLTIEMIVFKFKFTQKEELTFDDVKEIVEDIKKNPNGKLNSMIIKSFQKAVENQSKYLQMLSEEQYY
jgi:hypothetical protein